MRCMQAMKCNRHRLAEQLSAVDSEVQMHQLIQHHHPQAPVCFAVGHCEWVGMTVTSVASVSQASGRHEAFFAVASAWQPGLFGTMTGYIYFHKLDGSVQQRLAAGGRLTLPETRQ